MWICPSCDERHQDVFDICWKCGSDRTGQVDPEFRISESVPKRDQVIEPANGGTELPVPQFPDLTYFSIPPLICINLVVQFNKLRQFTQVDQSGNNHLPDFSSSPIEFVLTCAAFLLVLAPISFTICRHIIALSRTRHFEPSKVFVEYLSILSMFLLPESIRRSHRWFGPVYYGSYISIMFATIGAAMWLLTR